MTARGGLGRERELRRRLGERRPGREQLRGVFGQRFNASGVPQGSEFQVNSYTTGRPVRPCGGLGRERELRRRLESSDQDGSAWRRLRPALRRLRAPPGERVPGQLLHHGLPVRPRGGLGRERELRRRLDEPRPGRERRRRLRPALQRLRTPPGERVPGQLLHHGHPGQPRGGLGRERELRRRLGRATARTGAATGVFGQRFNASGLPQGSEFQVNSYTTGYQSDPAVASDANGNFVVVWRSYGQDGSGDGVFGQRFNASGVPQGSEFQVNSYTTGDQLSPRWPRTRTGTSSSSGTATTRTGAATASSASASTPSDSPRGASSRSTPTPRAASTAPRWPRPRTGTSSSPGPATARTGATLRRLRPALRRPHLQERLRVATLEPGGFLRRAAVVSSGCGFRSTTVSPGAHGRSGAQPRSSRSRRRTRRSSRSFGRPAASFIRMRSSRLANAVGVSPI